MYTSVALLFAEVIVTCSLLSTKIQYFFFGFRLLFGTKKAMVCGNFLSLILCSSQAGVESFTNTYRLKPKV